MSKNRDCLLSRLCEKLKNAKLLPRFPMHLSAWELDAETRKNSPVPEKMAKDLEDLMSVSPRAAYDPTLKACMRALKVMLIPEDRGAFTV